MRTLTPVLAISVLCGFRAPAAAEDWKLMMEQLASSDRQVAAQASDRVHKVVFPWLQSLDTASARAEVAQLAPLCDDPRPAVRFKAVALIATIVMVRMDSAAVIQPAVPALLRRFSDSNRQLKENAVLSIVNALPAPPAEAFPALRDLLFKDPEIRMVGGASKGLMALSPKLPAAEETVQEFLNQEKGPNRLVAALSGIGQAHTAGETTVACVAGYLRHRDERVAAAAIEALQQLGGKAAGALPALEALAADPDIPTERQAAAKTAIGVISRAPSPRKRDVPGRSASMSMLGLTGASPTTTENWKLLFEQVVSTDETAAAQARQQYFNVEIPRLESMDAASLDAQAGQIARLLEDAELRIRLQAVDLIVGLAQKRPDGATVLKSAIPALLRHFSDSNPRLKENAVLAITALRPAPPREAFPALRELLSDPEMAVAGLASKGLVRLSTTLPAAEEAVREFLNQEKRPDRLLPTLYSIGEARIGSEATVACVAGLLRHRDERVASAAILALEQLGGKAASALPALEAVLADQDMPPERQAAAMKAIAAISRRK